MPLVTRLIQRGVTPPTQRHLCRPRRARQRPALDRGVERRRTTSARSNHTKSGNSAWYSGVAHRLELGADQPGAQRGDHHARRLDLLVQALAEARHVRLGRRVHREPGAGWKLATLDTLSSQPRRRGTIAASAACDSRVSAATLSSISSARRSTSSSTKLPLVPKPALLTTRSIGRSASAIRAATASWPSRVPGRRRAPRCRRARRPARRADRRAGPRRRPVHRRPPAVGSSPRRCRSTPR